MVNKDMNLLEFCKGYPKTIKEISEHLSIAVKNVWVKVRELEEANLLIVKKDKFKKKTVVQTKQNKEFLGELKRLLIILESNKGSLSKEDFFEKAWESTPDDYITQQALNHLLFLGLLKNIYSITKEGEEFLKKNSKK